MGNGNLELCGVRIDQLDYSGLIRLIELSISRSESKIIGYANASVINSVYNNPELCRKLNQLDLIHPDGVGVYRALKYIYPHKENVHRMTGSDLYPMLIQKSIDRDWRIFFFGHDSYTLDKIKTFSPQLNIAGTQQGYDYDDKSVIEKINSSGAQILVIGLSFPIQEEWILENKNSLKPIISLLVGDGIKVFCGSKIRGPVFIRKIGFEWLVRFFSNPFKYWRRYLIGNPLFLYRIFRYKMAKLKKN